MSIYQRNLVGCLSIYKRSSFQIETGDEKESRNVKQIQNIGFIFYVWNMKHMKGKNLTRFLMENVIFLLCFFPSSSSYFLTHSPLFFISLPSTLVLSRAQQKHTKFYSFALVLFHLTTIRSYCMKEKEKLLMRSQITHLLSYAQDIPPHLNVSTLSWLSFCYGNNIRERVLSTEMIKFNKETSQCHFFMSLVSQQRKNKKQFNFIATKWN